MKLVKYLVVLAFVVSLFLAVGCGQKEEPKIETAQPEVAAPETTPVVDSVKAAMPDSAAAKMPVKESTGH